MYRSLDAYIASLSEKERQEYRDLIDDCVARNRRMSESIEGLRRDLKALSESWRELREKTELLLRSIARLNDGLRDLYGVIYSDDFAHKVESASGGYVQSMN